MRPVAGLSPMLTPGLANGGGLARCVGGGGLFTRSEKNDLRRAAEHHARFSEEVGCLPRVGLVAFLLLAGLDERSRSISAWYRAS